MCLAVRHLFPLLVLLAVGCGATDTFDQTKGDAAFVQMTRLQDYARTYATRHDGEG